MAARAFACFLLLSILAPLALSLTPSPSPAPSPYLSADAPTLSPAPLPDSLISSPPAPPPSSDLNDTGAAPAPIPAGSPESSPAPAPVEGDANHSDNVDVNGARNPSSSSGGKKAGIAVGVIVAAGLVGFGGLVYKKRQENIRRSQYSISARREFV